MDIAEKPTISVNIMQTELFWNDEKNTKKNDCLATIDNG